MTRSVFNRIMTGLKEALGIARGEIEVEPVRRPWTVDRDGRVRTDARPVVLRAKPRNDSGGCLHPCADDSEWRCECHRRLGNDFWFLPTDTCLDRK